MIFRLCLLIVLAVCFLDFPYAEESPSASSNIAAARSEADAVKAALPAYIADGLSWFEGPEIATVKKDLEGLQRENSDKRFIKKEKQLKRDWDSLVGLDEILQQKSAI